MSKSIKIMSFNSCERCINDKCKQTDKDLQVCFFYNRHRIKTLDDVVSEQLKDEIKFHILWFLDDKDCNLALTKSKELSQAVEKIIEEIKQSITRSSIDK